MSSQEDGAHLEEKGYRSRTSYVLEPLVEVWGLFNKPLPAMDETLSYTPFLSEMKAGLNAIERTSMLVLEGGWITSSRLIIGLPLIGMERREDGKYYLREDMRRFLRLPNEGRTD